MPSPPFAELDDPSRLRPGATAVVPIFDADLASLPTLLADLRAQEGVAVDIVVIDCTLDGDVPAARDVRVVRHASPSIGSALRSALGVTTDEWIALCSAHARYPRNRIARQLERVRYEDDIDLVTCDLHVTQPSTNGAEPYRYRVTGNATTLPAGCWEYGALIHRDALATLGTTCFAPVELELCLELGERSRVAHVAEPLVQVEAKHFEARSERTRIDAELLRQSAAPRATAPEISVILTDDGDAASFRRCLEGYARQIVAHGALQIVVAGEASADREPDAAVAYVDTTGTARPNKRNAALEHAHGRIVLFADIDSVPHPDTVQRHLDAHAELDGRNAVVIGALDHPTAQLAHSLPRLVASSPYVFDQAHWSPGQQLSGSAVRAGNFSAPREAVAAVGGFDAHLDSEAPGATDADLGIRLEAAGSTFHYRPECRVTCFGALDFAAVRARQRETARTHAHLFRKHPARLSGLNWGALTRQQLDQRRSIIRPHLPTIEAAAQTLADVDLERLERAALALKDSLGNSIAATATRLHERLGELFCRVNVIWWELGFRDAFDELGLVNFTDVFAEWRTEVPQFEGHAVLLRPAAAPTYVESAIGWTTRVELWLSVFGSRLGEGNDGTFLALLADPVNGLSVEEIQRAVAPLLTRARRVGRSTPVAIVEASDAEAERVLFEEARAWIPSGSERDDDDCERAKLTNCERLDLVGDATKDSPHWPLSTHAPRRIFAWPDWSAPESMAHLIDAFRALIGRTDVCLVLRHDPERDAAPEPGLAKLQNAFEACDAHNPLDVLLESAPLDDQGWTRLSRSVDALLEPTGARHAEALAVFGLPSLATRDDVEHWLAANETAPTYPIPVLSHPETSHA